MRALALDFDGVISDSAAEAFVVSLITLQQMHPVEEWAALTDRVASMSRAEILAEPLCRAFVEGMPLGNRAEDFGVVLRALASSASLADQAAYDRVFQDVGAAFRDEFHERFYVERAALRARAPEAWLALMAPYSAFLDVLRRHAGDVTLAVATAKDRTSVDLLLAEYGVEDLFAPDLILDKTAGPDKRAHVRALAERLGLDLQDVTFVDDKVNHLDSVSRLSVRCALASWGYNGEREWRLAESRGYPVLDLERVDAQLFGTG
jgi:phosphoglycolate phosphatase-like HAD superfamily hydrolase